MLLVSDYMDPEGTSFLVHEGLGLNVSFQHRSLSEEVLAAWVEVPNVPWGSIISDDSLNIQFITHGFEFSSNWELELETVGKLISNKPSLRGGVASSREDISGADRKYIDNFTLHPLDPGSYFLVLTPVERESGKRGLSSFLSFERRVGKEEMGIDQNYELPTFHASKGVEDKVGALNVSKMVFVGSLSFGFSISLFLSEHVFALLLDGQKTIWLSQWPSILATTNVTFVSMQPNLPPPSSPFLSEINRLLIDFPDRFGFLHRQLGSMTTEDVVV